MKKWQYRILARINGKEYLIWTYSKHFEETVNPTRRQKRIMKKFNKKYGFSSNLMISGMAHCQTAMQWVKGINKNLNSKDATDKNWGYNIMKDGLFNPHYRLNSESYPDIWFKPEKVEYIYFEMYLLNKGEQPNEKIT